MDSSSDKKEELRQQLRTAALEYHQIPRPGKISVTPTKGLLNQRDLALAYSPGVAAPCEEIVKDPANSYKYTARGNLVAVISNGTAVLGLGNIGPLASKPVMEGKGVLFKKFAAIDVFDIEINESDPDKLVDIIASLEPTFGGVNLEDIKAPECFYIERKLRERMKIPVFHDDQHGTAIIVGAAVAAALAVARQRPGRNAGVLAVRQPDPAGRAGGGRAAGRVSRRPAFSGRFARIERPPAAVTRCPTTPRPAARPAPSRPIPPSCRTTCAPPRSRTTGTCRTARSRWSRPSRW
jgi:hypothetical protein